MKSVLESRFWQPPANPTPKHFPATQLPPLEIGPLRVRSTRVAERSPMRVTRICAWCSPNFKAGPNEKITHGICAYHQQKFERGE